MLKNIVIITLSLGCTSVLFSQGHDQRGGGNTSIPGNIRKELGLSDDDLSRLETSYIEYRKDIQTARRSSQGGDRSKVAEVRNSYLAEVKAMDLLSEDQLETYTKFLNQKRKGSRDMTALRSQLDLTPEQAKKFDAANKAYAQLSGKIRNEYEGDRAGYMQALGPLREKRDQMMASFLTGDQLAIYKKEIQQRRSGHHH